MTYRIRMALLGGVALGASGVLGAGSIQAAPASPACLRAIQYRCTLAEPVQEIGAIRLALGKSRLEILDQRNHYWLVAEISGAAPVVHLTAYDSQGKSVAAQAAAPLGTEFVRLTVASRTLENLPTQLACVLSDRGPDADGRAYVSLQAPPAPQPENVKPNPSYVWIPGYWQLRTQGWAWQPGYWSRPVAGRRYEPGEWALCDGKYLWVDGRWI